ncbi:MAG: hypothetical protein MRY83_13890 [Flavobacteriales bacterium]|nr:hypothetical protein [Flavobacteriales bacterium]
MIFEIIKHSKPENEKAIIISEVPDQLFKSFQSKALLTRAEAMKIAHSDGMDATITTISYPKKISG